ncbi:MAG: hypothetical protein H7Y43_04900 [Akkermansiaceae bacterium]|nr:hypothetical protein [Verrucomicrobiales bacterium]
MKKISLTIAACLIGAVSQAQLIDDFGVAGLGEYTQTRVLDNGIAEVNVSFSDASGKLSATYAGTISQPEQVLLLRNDFSLAIGYRLLVDVSFLTQTSSLDFGLAVSQTATPAGVVNPTPTDTRLGFNWAAVYVRPSQNTVRAGSFINGVAVTGTGILNVDETLVGQLFIDRDSATSFTLGYYDTSAVRVVSRTAVFTATDVGTAIGFYGDLRAPGTLGDLDNLRIVAIPEPAATALAGVGMLTLIGRLRRRA